MAQRNTLIVEIDYAEDLTVSTAHAIAGALSDGEGVTMVRARVAPPEHRLTTMLQHWDSAEFGPAADK